MDREVEGCGEVIPIRNVYYMLSYAFSSLRSEGFNDVVIEEFDNAADLLAAILTRGINRQVKRGLVRAYETKDEITPSPRGKIDVTSSVKGATLADRKLACSYDEFTANAYLNRILKTAGRLLLKIPIGTSRKRDLRRALVYLQEVRPLDPHRIEWRQRYDRSTHTYRMLVNVCRMAVTGALQSAEAGDMKLEEFIDDQKMSALYEHFILEYFRQEHADVVKADAPYIRWALDDDSSDMLPVMHTDVTLRSLGASPRKTLVIDAKYYGHNTQARFSRRTVHSGNLYQIFSYVKNEHETLCRLGEEHEVSGMLLYAKTDEGPQPDAVYHMSGNEIAVRTLDLDCDFADIAAQLDNIVEEHF